MNVVLRIARKEFASFISSPVAYIFLGAFLAVTLFVFFWVETFFARNIADVRPLFEWMPLLLIFLVSAITMRMWAEERRSGTIEFLLTVPVTNLQLVLGKFAASLALIAVALLLTLPLPIVVNQLGPLDWGPVFGGYLATLLLAAAYSAIGLFLSSRSENQIVSLILTAAVCGLLYVLGSDGLTALFDTRSAEILKLLGSGSRFHTITRGVIDLRDLYYYISLIGIFLSLNILALEQLRWAGNPGNALHRRWQLLTAFLVSFFFIGNLALAPVAWVRADLTRGNIYSISATTKDYLAQLEESLLIRGYFSAQTHPLLAPLVPRLRDLIEEYAIAAEGGIQVEFIDPQQHPELEQEANETYNIQPVPFQFADKYQATVVNSYFNILIQYGGQHEVLGFEDLIEVMMQSEADLKVELRNPEYDLTRSIKRLLYAYRESSNVFDKIPYTLSFKGYISDRAKLPDVLQKLREELDSMLLELEDRSSGKLSVDISDPDADGGVLASQITGEFGFRPMIANATDTNQFWFYMTLEGDGRVIQVPLPEQFDKAGLELGMQAALKRFSRGFMKTVALHTPVSTPAVFGMPASGKRFDLLRTTLAEEYNLSSADMRGGRVPDDADILLLVSPDRFSIKQLFAVDQFLMQGGTVVVATSPFDVEIRDALTVSQNDSALIDWLSHHGINLETRMVLDPRNSSFPIPVERHVGDIVFRETRMASYPFFNDIREDGIGQDSGLTENIDQITMTWPSPISLDEEKNANREIRRLLTSSELAWTTDDMVVEPDYETYGNLGFPPGDQPGEKLLAVVVEGQFESYFKGKPSPFTTSGEETDADAGNDTMISGVVDRSPESSRIILFASRSFLTDAMLDLASSGTGTLYRKPLLLLANTIDWSLEDRGLLAIRGRDHYSGTLRPLDRDEQIFWEYLIYGLSLLGLILVGLIRVQAKRMTASRYGVYQT